MDKPPSYCSFVKDLPLDNVHRQYHDFEYGFPILDDNELFGRLILEINQAGLSWEIILKKKANFRKAYAGYNIKKVANFNDNDIERLLNDKGIVRNRLKINAAIYNAQKIVDIQLEHDSFKNWLDLEFPKEKKEWVKLFKKTFKFTGGEITNEFLMSTGYLGSPHEVGCPILKKIENKKWETTKL